MLTDSHCSGTIRSKKSRTKLRVLSVLSLIFSWLIPACIYFYDEKQKITVVPQDSYFKKKVFKKDICMILFVPFHPNDEDHFHTEAKLHESICTSNLSY